VDRTLFSVKQRSPLEQPRRGADRLTPRALAGGEVIDAQQEKLEGARTDRMILPVGIDTNGGPALLVKIMKQLQPSSKASPINLSAFDCHSRSSLRAGWQSMYSIRSDFSYF
jgi:hypothetical protein